MTLLRTVSLAAPLIWFANHAAQFALAPLACAQRSNAILWIVAIAALLLDAGSGLAAWTLWQRGEKPSTVVAASGIALSVSFFIVIFAQMIPSLMLAACT
jgi:hypothetical protein